MHPGLSTGERLVHGRERCVQVRDGLLVADERERMTLPAGEVLLGEEDAGQVGIAKDIVGRQRSSRLGKLAHRMREKPGLLGLARRLLSQLVALPGTLRSPASNACQAANVAAPASDSASDCRASGSTANVSAPDIISMCWPMESMSCEAPSCRSSVRKASVCSRSVLTAVRLMPCAASILLASSA